jgi:hypothetical protein
MTRGASIKTARFIAHLKKRSRSEVPWLVPRNFLKKVKRRPHFPWPRLHPHLPRGGRRRFALLPLSPERGGPPAVPRALAALARGSPHRPALQTAAGCRTGPSAPAPGPAHPPGGLALAPRGRSAAAPACGGHSAGRGRAPLKPRPLSMRAQTRCPSEPWARAVTGSRRSICSTRPRFRTTAATPRGDPAPRVPLDPRVSPFAASF